MNNIVTIVASNKIILDAGIIGKICDILKIELSSVKQLQLGRAYDIPCPHLSIELERKLSNFLAGFEIDVFFLNEGFRSQKKLLLSDMDGTLIENECIDEIARSVGKYDQIAAMTKEAMEGDMLFEGSLVQRVALLEGVRENQLSAIYDERITLHSGVKQTAQKLKAMGAKLIIVSGGFTYFCQRVAEDSGFDDFYANELIFTNGILTGKVKPPIFSSDSKAEILQKLMREGSLAKDQVIAIGDGANDLPFLTKVPFSVGYKAKPLIAAKVRFNICHSDFTAILFILGMVIPA
ncbi:MAG: phosphoserine phosphatase SerB [Rickettsiales bacterium]|jgi:phosphoserine phosphatase|nr:phosphoserine phosphatase SerB [Rickettsiales bacterium]